MLEPKKTKYRRHHRGNRRGMATRGSHVAFGTYGAITVSWLDPNDSNPATNQHILGGYGGSVQSGFMDSQSVTVSEEEYELKGIDISANFDLLGPN